MSAISPRSGSAAWAMASEGVDGAGIGDDDHFGCGAPDDRPQANLRQLGFALQAYVDAVGAVAVLVAVAAFLYLPGTFAAWTGAPLTAQLHVAGVPEVQVRFAEHGPNELRSTDAVPLWRRILAQFPEALGDLASAGSASI